MKPSGLPVAAAGFVLAALLSVPAAKGVPLPVSDHFESGPVHPVELTPDGTRVLVAHLADHRLSVFDVTGPAPVRTAQIPVGVEPVTVRARTADEAWVVNHLSDSISLVKLSTGHVFRTLLPGDEPTDVVFANGKAYVCVSQEDVVRVYDLADLNAAPATVPLSHSDPRSLAVSPAGDRVYVAALDSQNETTAIHFQTVLAGGGLPAPDPPMAGALPDAPDVGLIVRYDGTQWRDETGASWSGVVPYTLYDHDVIAIDTTSDTVVQTYRGVGTSLFNLGVGPDGTLWVTNLEASNEIRFEPNLKGSFVRNRVTFVAPGGAVTPVHLNAHIDYGNPAGSAGERALSLSTPLDIAVAGSGNTAYVAAIGSARVGVLDAAGNVTRRIDVGEGPAGLALDESRDRLYVYNRFSSTLSVVDLSDDSSVELSLGFDGSHPDVLAGRRFLYDGELSSAHGDLACASCHLFGGMDNIAWDLGDPQGTFQPPVQPLTQGFHPMKGPMTTQTLMGLSGTEPLHWRGDREDFVAFNGAFESLMGRGSQLAPSDMQAFEDFVLTMKHGPNPFRELDGSHLPSLNGADPANGEVQFQTGNLVAGECVGCHAQPTGENGLIIPASVLLEDQDMVVPQLRNLYEKTRFDETAAQNVRGFGYTHDGAVDDLFTFLDFPAFNFSSVSEQEDVAAFLLAFDSDVPAAVGAQWTMDGANEGAGLARVNTLVSLAQSGSIGLIAKGREPNGDPRGWVYEAGLGFRPDRALESHETLNQLLARAGADTEVTFTAVLSGNEFRRGVDQDGDGFLDLDERDVGADPSDPGSTPDTQVGVPVVNAPTPPGLWLTGANPARVESRFGVRVGDAATARVEIFDLQGRRVRTLMDGPAAGRRELVWDLRDGHGRSVSSGVYFVRLATPESSARQRVVVLR